MQKLILVVASLSATLLTSSFSNAQGTGGGTIYFADNGLTYTMNSDGNNKTPLVLSDNPGNPSRALYGGHRWFLQTRQIAGQYYPNGDTRREVYAVRDDAAIEVQLSDQIDLETNTSVGWCPGNSEISFVARRWVLGTVSEGGVYTAALSFDLDGNITGLAAQPTSPTIPIALVPAPTELWPDMSYHDWAPNGAEVCYGNRAGNEIRIADGSGYLRTIVSGVTGVNGLSPGWSPAGTKILFYSGSNTGIETISPNGTGRKVIVKPGSRYMVGAPSWSPTGSHVMHYRYTTFHVGPPAYYRYDVTRCTATGGSATVLTSSLPSPGGFPNAWR